MRPVNAEDVQGMLENAQIIFDGEYCGYCTEDVNIDKIPTVDVAAVAHSSWSVFAEVNYSGIRTGKHVIVCRRCGHNEKILHSAAMPNYCSNCGAKMNGKEQTDATN